MQLKLSFDRKLTLALLVVLPVISLATANSFYKSVLVFGMINSVAAVGLCLMLGFAGQISLGQAAFYGIGAYTTTYLANNFGVPAVFAIVAGSLMSMLVGWAISRPLSRLHDHYLGMATLAFGIIM